MSSELNTLITSGAYIGEEMQAEFGRIPPAFLPVGSAYLVQHQLAQLKDRENKWLSLPSDFELSEAQERILAEEDVRLIRVDSQTSLGTSVFQAILEIDPAIPLEIIHGDTLVLSPGKASIDCVSVTGATEQYKWGLVEIDGTRICAVHDVDRGESLTEQTLILSGYFAFQDAWQFLKCLVASGFKFVDAIDQYASDTVVGAITKLEALDFGHQKTYYASRQHLATTRHFNYLEIDDYVVRKKSDDAAKIDAESNWLRSIPANLQPFTARLIEDHASRSSGTYATLYGNFPTVAELYLARSSRLVWRKILESCNDFLQKASRHTDADRASPLSWLVIDKLRDRLSRYPSHLPDPSDQLTINGKNVGNLNSIVEHLAQLVRNAPQMPPCIMHGDFCFSNMLFDTRCDRILLIDPRGLVNDEVTIYGDIRYDIAKLGHSIIGRYDEIVGQHLIASNPSKGDYLLVVPNDSLREWLQDQFLESEIDGNRFDNEIVLAAVVSLFLAMIPLHSDDVKRQQTLFANALRMYVRFF